MSEKGEVMDAELKAKWVAALRSGEFKQCQGALTDGDGYCCLGVLATLCGARFDEIGNRSEDVLASNSHPTIDRHVPFSIRQKLAEMNDDIGNDFLEIADYIETKL